MAYSRFSSSSASKPKERRKQEDKVKRMQQLEEYFKRVKLLGSAMLGKKRRVMRSVAVRWTTKAAAGHGGVASSSGIPATIATVRDGSYGYHGFDDCAENIEGRWFRGTGAVVQRFKSSEQNQNSKKYASEVACDMFCGFQWMRFQLVKLKLLWLMDTFQKKDQLFSDFKEALVLLLDVGPSMHSVIPVIEKLCSMLVQKKLIYNRHDKVGVVLFGTKETYNELTLELGGYRHVVVLKNLKDVDGDMVKKRLCLITNAQCPIKASIEGTKEEQVTTIAKQMSVHGTRMESIIVRGKLCRKKANKTTASENHRLLNIFSKETSTRIVYVGNPVSLFGALKTQNKTPHTVFRGDLELSSKMKIKVWVYKKTIEELPNLKKCYESPDIVVPSDQRVRGYHYGPQLVPMSKVALDAVKFKPEKGVKLLGFTNSSNVLRHYYMKDVNIFIPEPENTNAMLALSALARAMKEMNKPDSFYFNVLPFAEDVREFQFPSFSKLPAALQPNQQQLEAAANLVEMLDLAPCGKEKALLPDFTPNPRFYRCLELKSKNPGAAVPPIDETLKKITEPDSNLVLKNKSVIDSFRRCFEPNENPRHKKLRRLLLEKSSSSEEDCNRDITPLPSNLIEVKVDSVCNPTPPQVFEAMSGSRNTQDSVVKAIKDRRNKIFELIDESNDGDNYPEALQCLTALQEKCIVDQEALVLLLDVGPSMHSVIPEIEKVCSMLVEKKLIFTKYDEVGVVLFGTEDTDNELTEEVGGYQHVVVLKNIKVVEGDIVEALQQLPRGATHVLDAIIVGMDMLIKKFGETNKGKKRLCLITNAQCPIKEPFEGTKEEQVTTIAKQMTVHGMRMESIILRGKLSQDANKKIMDENDQLLRIFSTETSARSTYVENPVSLLGALRTRNITPSTIFKGDLELSPKLKIKVLVYKKTAEEKFPTLKKFSDKAASTDKFATHEVKVDYEYKSSQEPDKVVPPDQRIKGYRYGPQIVPISQAEWDAVKFKPEKGLKLLGFTDSSNVLRHQYMKDVNVFIAETGNTKATLALSSLARAMKEMNKVAILRCVWRHGQANVVIGVLTPNLSDKENIPDSLYFNVLPFAEDVREFQFPSFSNFPAPIQPNEQQLEAAANLVKMLDLAPQGKEEVLLPDFTPNPRFYRYLELKSKHADAAVPPLDDTLKKITEPDDELLQQNKSVIEKFRQSFELKENPRHKKSRRLLREERYGSGEENSKGEIPALASNLIEDKPNVEVDNIGDLTPVQDFEAMFARRDNPDWVVKAIDAMKNKIHDLIEDSHEGDNNSKGLECLAALRKGCVNEQEPKQFNSFLRDIWSFCQEKNLHDFCDSLSSKGITLIPKSEAADSEVTEDEARSFLVKSQPKV
ncbi:hypothetical protein Ahy_A02g005336 isoform F [Arachis hypogaea]|uniref:ATP-dependent DNA helicase 2 subunit KU80 n=1 Tax=Arachis hypogaea TaxID=3818 RepID=A0A445E6G4_ARAHY|nr:hypothetical protein Ahy_A02g005336 isoform F [Arachis hypogaea]